MRILPDPAARASRRSEASNAQDLGETAAQHYRRGYALQASAHDMPQAKGAKPGMMARMRQWWSQFIYQWQLQAMVAPGIIFMIVFNFIPIYGLVLAFKNYTVVDTISGAPWVGWENFRIILSDKYFWDSVWNTMGISAIKLSLGFVLPIILAVMIYEVPWGPFKRIVQTLTYLPHFFSWIILGGMLINWLSHQRSAQRNTEFRRYQRILELSARCRQVLGYRRAFGRMEGSGLGNDSVSGGYGGH
jgi:hypothetical protein